MNPSATDREELGSRAPKPPTAGPGELRTSAADLSDIANPELVALVREAKGWTQKELGFHADLTQGHLSKVEAGLVDLKGHQLVRVAKALDCPVRLLVDATPVRGLEVTCLHHRRRHTTMSVRTIKQVEAVTHLSRVTVEGLMSGLELVPELELVRLDIDAYPNAAAVARDLRAAWRLPAGPVRDVTALLEAAGVVIVERALGTRGQDAVSSWPREPGRPALMLINDGLPVDRRRFTLIHELGHLVMHALPGDEQEEQANLFASEFLVPADEVVTQMAGLTTRDFPRLLELKAYWGVSVAALVRRAKDVDVISERQYREFQVQLGRLGWRKREPGTLRSERAAILQRAIAAHRDMGATDVDLAAAALMTPSAFARHYASAPHGATELRVRYGEGGIGP